MSLPLYGQCNGMSRQSGQSQVALPSVTPSPMSGGALWALVALQRCPILRIDDNSLLDIRMQFKMGGDKPTPRVDIFGGRALTFSMIAF